MDDDRDVAANRSSVRDDAETLDEAFIRRVSDGPNRTALRYFDLDQTAGEVSATVDSLAVALQHLEVRPGDRVGIYLQNVPGFAYTLLALWRIGATPLLLNPMYRGQELAAIVADAQPVGIVYADDTGPEVADALGECGLRWFVRTDTVDWIDGRDHGSAQPATIPLVHGHHLMRDLAGAFRGSKPDPVDVTGDSTALLAYTSGTTGPAKGAMITHRGVLHVARAYAQISNHQPGEVVLAMAPMFHITGAVLGAATALVTESALVLAGRFDAEVIANVIEQTGVTSTVASITAFNALLNIADTDPARFATIRAAYSGGAPVPLTTVERIRANLGFEVRNVYGMTETSSAATAVPLAMPNRAHPETGNLSIGRALPGVAAVVADQRGNPVPAGVQGELLLGGPSIMAGYWRNPEATANAFTGDLLRTGDGAVTDEDGWIYLVDRLKDQINVSGYKVWPREVEDVLYTHRAVHEAAVVGQADDYQGEAVLAYVALRPGETATAAELRAHVRDRLAAYKVPRQVVIVDDLPKTASGKIQRNRLRA